MKFVATCVGATYEDITNMTSRAQRVTYRTFFSRVGSAFVEAQKMIGYDLPECRRPSALRMKHDRGVTYWKSVYQDRPCYYFRWSSIEHIFCDSE